ncbi:MAG: hypothetical protein A2754_01245, partial [Candidatus Magasanikbacteria bacterium RIFCSPHIGHO2_01_FULL_47_8]
MINFVEELNSEQLEVVHHGDGPCLVLAGAGSGKTRTIVYRVAYLLEQGIKPEHILLVTFTNKAAQEMKARIGKLLGKNENEPGALPWSGTFHHIAYRILKMYAPLLGYGNNFTVLDSDDSQAILKLCSKEVRPDSGGKKFPSAHVLSAIISYAQNAELAVEDVINARFSQWAVFQEEIKQIASEYRRRKKEANAMDFDDLLANLLVLLHDEKVRKKYADQFAYILVDEYQDTNRLQASIIKEFSSTHKNIVAVGDDAQSIYSFRAADIQNILNFQNDYLGAKIFKLETNYRSTQEILNLANSVIANNREQYKKKLHTVLQNGQKPQLYPELDQQGEADFVATKIQGYLSEGVAPNEIAVLFRAAYHSQMLEVELVRRGIDYDYRGGVRFFERAHIKDALAYLRVWNNRADIAAWLRVLMHEEGIGPAAAQKVIEKVRQVSEVAKVREVGLEVLGSKAQVGWNNFVRIWDAMAKAPDPTPAGLIEAVLDSPYREYLESEFVDSRERLADIKQLVVFAERYDNTEQFLAETTLQESFRAAGGAGESVSPPAGGGARGGGSNKIVLST